MRLAYLSEGNQYLKLENKNISNSVSLPLQKLNGQAVFFMFKNTYDFAQPHLTTELLRQMLARQFAK